MGRAEATVASPVCAVDEADFAHPEARCSECRARCRPWVRAWMQRRNMRRISSHDRATASLPSETRPRSEARERQRAAAVGKNSCSAAGSGYKRVAIESRRIRQAHPLSSLVTHIQARQTHTSAVKESGFGPLLTPASGSPAKRTSASLHLAAIRQSHTTLYARSHATTSPDDSA